MAQINSPMEADDNSQVQSEDKERIMHSHESTTSFIVDIPFCRLSYCLSEQVSDQEVIRLMTSLRHDDDWIASPSEYARKKIPVQHPLYPLVLNFDWKAYQDANADLSDLNPKQLLLHYVRHGLVEPRSLDPNQSLIDRRLAIHAIPSTNAQGELLMSTNLQVVVHCYYAEVLSIMEPYLRILSRLGARIHLYVTNADISSELLNDFLNGLELGSSTSLPKHQWKRSANLHEDWPTFHEAFTDGLFDVPGITYKFQTKKSSRLLGDGGRLWTEELIQSIAGSYNSVIRVCKAILLDGFGMAGSEIYKRTGLGVNANMTTTMAKTLGINQRNILQTPFVAGSMFAIDNDLAKDFYIKLGDIDYTNLPTGGNEHCGRYYGHAIERCIGYFCHERSAGIKWLL